MQPADYCEASRLDDGVKPPPCKRDQSLKSRKTHRGTLDPLTKSEKRTPWRCKPKVNRQTNKFQLKAGFNPQGHCGNSEDRSALDPKQLFGFRALKLKFLCWDFRVRFTEPG